MTKYPRLRNEHGSGMIYFLLLSALVGIVVTGIQRKSGQDLNRQKVDKIMAARATLHRRIKSTAENNEAIRFSLSKAATTSAFAICLNTNPPVTCGFAFSGGTLAVRKSAAEFSLFNPGTGIKATPENYTIKGEACSTSTDPCAFEARSYYLRDCVNGSPCSVRLFSLVQVNFIGNATDFPDTPRLASLPKDSAFANFASLKTDANENNLLFATTQICPIGAMVDKIVNGEITCKCIPQVAEQIGVNSTTGYPICDISKACPSGQNFTGISITGLAICSAPVATNCVVRQMTNNAINCGQDAQGQKMGIKTLNITQCGAPAQGANADQFQCFSGDPNANYGNNAPPPAEATCCSINP